MTDRQSRPWTLEQVYALRDDQVRTLSVEDFASALRVSQAEGTSATPDPSREVPLPEGTARV